jgi:hypothetical protein
MTSINDNFMAWNFLEVAAVIPKNWGSIYREKGIFYIAFSPFSLYHRYDIMLR